MIQSADPDVIGSVSMTGTRGEFFSSELQESHTDAPSSVFPLTCPPSVFDKRNDG